MTPVKTTSLTVRIFQAGALLFMGLCLAFVAMEGLVRLFGLDRTSLPIWSDRPKLYLYHQAAQSAQDQTHLKIKTKNTLRIAVVGDSFTFGPYVQADDAFSKKLERSLNLNITQPRVEVINYGVPRYSTSHEAAVVKTALDEGADLVILQITLNDPEVKPYRPTGLIKEDRFGQPIASNWLVDKSRAVKLIMTRWANFKSVDYYKRYFLYLWSSKITFPQFKSALNQITNLTRQRKVPLVAVVFPLFGFPNDETYPFHSIHKKIGEHLRNRKIEYLDLFESYRGIPLDRLTVLPGRDRHPNEIAHRIAAEALYAWLQERELLQQGIFANRKTPNRISVNFEENMEPLLLE